MTVDPPHNCLCWLVVVEESVGWGSGARQAPARERASALVYHGHGPIDSLPCPDYLLPASSDANATVDGTPASAAL